MRAQFTASVSYRIICLLSSLFLLGVSTRADAQKELESQVSDSLRRALKVRDEDTLFLDRSFHPGLFPGVTFFRTRYVSPDAIDVPIRTAGAAVVHERVVIVRSASDLSRLWDAILGENRKVRYSFELGIGCGVLVVSTGLVSNGARFIQAPEEIPRRFRGSLDPPAAVQRITSPQEQESDNGVAVSQWVWDTNLLRVRCSLSRADSLFVRIDTVATGYTNKP